MGDLLVEEWKVYPGLHLIIRDRIGLPTSEWDPNHRYDAHGLLKSVHSHDSYDWPAIFITIINIVHDLLHTVQFSTKVYGNIPHERKKSLRKSSVKLSERKIGGQANKVENSIHRPCLLPLLVNYN